MTNSSTVFRTDDLKLPAGPNNKSLALLRGEEEAAVRRDR